MQDSVASSEGQDGVDSTYDHLTPVRRRPCHEYNRPRRRHHTQVLLQGHVKLQDPREGVMTARAEGVGDNPGTAKTRGPLGHQQTLRRQAGQPLVHHCKVPP